MRTLIFHKSILIIMTIGMVMISACSSDDGGSSLEIPEAGFTLEVDGKTVTLTNTSVGEEVTYAWSFGDDQTSTEASPVHTYEANGSYVISLTVTNESGSDISESAVEIANITIDGDVSDWDDVEALSYDGDGTFKEVKVENLGNDKLYFYILATSDATSFLDLYLNLDYENAVADSDQDTTGLATGVYPMSNLGWDVLFEGFFGYATARDNLSGMFYGIFYYPQDELDADGIFSNNLDFGSRDEPGFTTEITFSEITAVGDDVAYEFSVDLSSLPSDLVPEQGERLQFFIDEWVNGPESTDGWWGSFIGHYPTGQSTEEGEAATYTLK